jgi:antirestriction protein ArdC
MSVYDIVTNRIIELLEQGEIPWKKPWKTIGGPKNLVSRKPYQGVNQFLLNVSPYNSPYWLTFKQASEKGGFVRKGEKSTLVVFWKWLETKKNDSVDNDPDASHRNGKIPLLRYYKVFNLDQVEGISPPQEEPENNPFTPIEKAERIIANMPLMPEIHFGGDRAYYSPGVDYIQLPHKERFHSPPEFYSTLFHEMAHATGHAMRLGRKSITESVRFGNEEYSKEELLAELCASMLCAESGIEQSTINNSAAYIQGWLLVLRNDKKILLHAAANANRAKSYILGKGEEETDN